MPDNTPGVFIKEIPTLPPSVAPVETAIPAFIGYTERATRDTDGDLHLEPTRIKSFTEYEELFGGADPIPFEIEIDADDRVTITTPADLSLHPEYLMYYSLRMYFANGGGPCYIISAGSYDDTVDLDDGSGNGLSLGLNALAKEDEPTLIVIPDAVKLTDVGTYHQLLQDALAQCGNLKDRFAICDIYDGDNPLLDDNVINGATGFRDGIGTLNLKYGAAYFPNLLTTLTYAYAEDEVQVDINGGGNVAMDTLRGGENDKYYHLTKTAIEKQRVALPPSSAIAGIYAFVDRTRGVWKAPANVSLNSVQRPLVNLDNTDQDGMNVTPSGKSVNAIRTFTGKGVLVWGARTLAGNDNEWRYVNVRRFFNMAEESIKKATEQFVFESNDANTWVKVRSMIENFLFLQWRAGALAGAVPEEAFYVRVGLGQTMTALDILEGRMNVEIGMAVVRPAEFIILKFSHKMQES